MANPNLAKNIGVKVTNANIGEYVIIRNFRTGKKLTQKLGGSDRSTVFNPAPTLVWLDGDKIQAEIRGRLQGVKQGTIRSGGTSITITASADTTTSGVSL